MAIRTDNDEGIDGAVRGFERPSKREVDKTTAVGAAIERIGRLDRHGDGGSEAGAELKFKGRTTGWLGIPLTPALLPTPTSPSSVVTLSAYY